MFGFFDRQHIIDRLVDGLTNPWYYTHVCPFTSSFKANCFLYNKTGLLL